MSTRAALVGRNVTIFGLVLCGGARMAIIFEDDTVIVIKPAVVSMLTRPLLVVFEADLLAPDDSSPAL